MSEEKKKRKSKKANYVNDQAYLDAIVRWKATWPKDENDVPIKQPINDEIARDFVLKIVYNTVNSGSFRGYSDDWREQMISDGLYYLTKYLGNFDETRYNSPFNYSLTIIMKLFKTVIVKEKLRLATKSSYRLFLSDTSGTYDIQDDSDGQNLDGFEGMNNSATNNFSQESAQKYYEYEKIHRNKNKRTKRTKNTLDDLFE